jgi:hypothetical protein
MNKKWIYWALAVGALFIVIFFVSINKPAIPITIADIKSPENEKNIPFIQIHDGCDWASVGTCVNMRSGPGAKFPVVGHLRNGVVLKVGDSTEVDGQTWYKIAFGAELLYPERVEGDLYVAQTDSVKLLTDTGNEYATHVSTTTAKRILVDVSEQMIYAYDGNTLFMKESISTGLEFTPTPRGTFFILKKTPARYMQGPIKGVSEQKYDLPGVPWDLYFTKDGSVIHGAYWHDKFGEKWSHGCVNLPLESAEKLYKWADAGIPVVVQD